MMKEMLSDRAATVARIIRSSLEMVIPVLFIGSITVLLNGFPIWAYQDLLNAYLGGALKSIIITVQYATVGILAIYITIALNLSYMDLAGKGQRSIFRFGSLLGCLTGFFILAGFFSGEPDLSLLSGQGVFSAMVAGLVGSALFQRFEASMKTPRMIFADGADSGFNASLHVILPFLSVTMCFAVANYLITVCFHVQSLQHLFMKAMDMIFMRMHRSYSSGLLFVTLINIMWWFGIHGNNVLNQVAEDMFVAIIPGEIVSKSFIDTFVNMGGTGCTIGLLIAMLLFGRRSSTRRLFGMGLLPGLFNIGEMLVFGFPVIYNPMMAIPFILAPILCFTNAFLLTRVGFVPPVTNEVIWTTPALMSGYIATGSVRGILVQLINILISTACYAPFVLRYEKQSLRAFSSEMETLVGMLGDRRAPVRGMALIECEGNVGRLAKHLAVELEVSLSASASGTVPQSAEGPLSVVYDQLHDAEGECVGLRARLQWQHKLYGIIHPPLVLQVARESGDLYDLETYVMESAMREHEGLRSTYGDRARMYIDVTALTLHDRRFIPFLQTLADRYKLRSGRICLVVTGEAEQPASEDTEAFLERIRMLGYMIRDEEGIGDVCE